MVQYSSVYYKAHDNLAFDKFHTSDVIYDWLRKWADKYPDLVDFYEVGKSFEGRPILSDYSHKQKDREGQLISLQHFLKEEGIAEK
ncbi:MAG: hypothetical protein MZV63_46460 [Marinilabiliales bacterium]|nr:hypothetical protein [Marinilabiliales bacterium]